MPYCNLCENLTIKKLWLPNIYYHAKTLAALDESSTAWVLCTNLLRYINADHRIEDTGEIRSDEVLVETQISRVLGEQSRSSAMIASVAATKHERNGLDHNGRLMADHGSRKLVHEACLYLPRGHNIQKVWFDLVADYSDCELTFLEDKLPALSGISSRIQNVRKDKYLAGHWKVTLDRSLFWTVGAPASRVKLYRAPSWSWASIDGVIHDWEVLSDIESWEPTVGSLQVLHASTEVQGGNPFGRVGFGKVVAKASTTAAHWDSDRRGWLSPSRPCMIDIRTIRNDPDDEDEVPTIILDHNGKRIGSWRYDNSRHGVFPGQVLTNATALTVVQSRRINTHSNDRRADSSSFWKDATYAPQTSLLVKGHAVYKQHPPEAVTEAKQIRPEKSPDEAVDYLKILVLK
jgi:hypothetical protein